MENPLYVIQHWSYRDNLLPNKIHTFRYSKLAIKSIYEFIVDIKQMDYSEADKIIHLGYLRPFQKPMANEAESFS